MRPWLLTLALLFGYRDPSGAGPLTVALVHRAEVQAHQTVARSFVRELDGDADVRIIELGPEQPWPDDRQPHAVVAVGSVADAAADERWPELPRASLLVFGAPPEPARADQDDAPPSPSTRFWTSAHTEPGCSADALIAAIPDGGRWIVVAETADDQAGALARALDGVVVQGATAGAVARQLRERKMAGTRLWIRGAPGLAVPEWLEYLGRMQRMGALFVGFDLPGGERFGLSRWVEPDLAAVGRAAARWTASLSGRRRPETLTVFPVPCLKSPTSDHLPD